MLVDELNKVFGDLLSSLKRHNIAYDVRVMPYGHAHIKVSHSCGMIYYIDKDSLGYYVEIIEGRIRQYFEVEGVKSMTLKVVHKTI